MDIFFSTMRTNSRNKRCNVLKLIGICVKVHTLISNWHGSNKNIFMESVLFDSELHKLLKNMENKESIFEG